MKTRWAVPVLVAVAALLLVAPATGARGAERWRECGSIAFAPNGEDEVHDIRARRTRCATARRVARAAEPTSVVDGPFRYRAARFTCRGRPTEEGLPVVRWTCTRELARVRFVMS